MTDSGEDVYRSVEEAWIHHVDEIMPTVEEIRANPHEAVKAFFFGGATAAIQIIYHYGFNDVRDELHKWTHPEENSPPNVE